MAPKQRGEGKPKRGEAKATESQYRVSGQKEKVAQKNYRQRPKDQARGK